jgi:co-chaperonin GroES (HSP10)
MILTLDSIQPLHRNVLARRYQKPERAGSIILPEAYRGDRTQTLYEVIRAGPCAEHACRKCRLDDQKLAKLDKDGTHRPYYGLNLELKEDDLISVRYSWVAVPLEVESGDDVFMIDARHIESVERWKEEEDEADDKVHHRDLR